MFVYEMDISLTSHINPFGSYRDILWWITWKEDIKCCKTNHRNLECRFPISGLITFK